MKVNFGGAVSRGWKFAKNTQRLTAQFLICTIAVMSFLLPVIFLYRNITIGALQSSALVQSYVWLFVALVVIILLLTYSTLMFMHNYANQKALGKSADYAKSRYLRFLLAMVIVGTISSIAEIVPFIGLILSFVAGLIFFFVQQEIAVRNSGLSKSFSNSYEIFKRNWFKVFLTLVISGLAGLLTIIVFAIPLFVVAFGTIGPAITSGQFITALLANMPLFAVTGLVLLVGVALATLWTIGIKTDVYMQLKKGKK